MFRVISGKFKGRRFKAPQSNVRPTTDFAKESLFNLLQNFHPVQGKNLLDLFAGTGSISLEFISRGGKSATLVEENPVLIKFIRETAEKLGISSQFHIYRSDVDFFLEKCVDTFDIIFVDPPFFAEDHLYSNIHRIIFSKNLLNDNGLLVIEHYSKRNLENLPYRIESRNYGAVGLSFFRKVTKTITNTIK